MWVVLLKDFRVSKKAQYSPKKPFKNEKLLSVLTLLCVIICIGSIIKVFIALQQDPVGLLTNLLVASGRLAAVRGNTSADIGLAPLLVANTAYLSAVLLAFRDNHTTPLILFHFTPALMATLLLSQKLIMLVAIATYITMAIIVNQMQNKEMKQQKISPRSKKRKYLLIITVITFSVLVSFISREGYNILNGEANLKQIFMTISSYSFGSIVAFSYFFDDYMNISWQTGSGVQLQHYVSMLGRFTFSGYFNQNVDTTFYVAAGDPLIIRSNIYTIFRGLIYDFGLIGGFLFFNLLGLFSVIIARPWVFGIKSGIFVASTFYLASYGFIGYLISPASARYTLLLSVEIFVLVAVVFPLSQRITWR